ncbi:hypothetical protein SAMN05443633_10666 [Chryseobacterium arachidis]|uniref:Uncharacterized protein n=1 Tax=Chryseobacterium arachidis TaxID=1416778 RepID=A0A1M5E0K0_9FLAO|nr:hypothetical protein SAMN05443633_10666 [Chryseobacterium arachidis]
MSSCKKEDQYFNVKDDLIYKYKNELFLKHTIILKNRNPKNSGKVIRFFNDVAHKNKVLKLKDFIDTKTFHQIKNNYQDRFIKDVYEDSKYQYIFRDHPASSPYILIKSR